MLRKDRLLAIHSLGLPAQCNIFSCCLIMQCCLHLAGMATLREATAALRMTSGTAQQQQAPLADPGPGQGGHLDLPADAQLYALIDDSLIEAGLTELVRRQVLASSLWQVSTHKH